MTQITYLHRTLGTVVTGIFLMASGDAAMPRVMGSLDQSPETIVQNVACLSTGPVTFCQHGRGDNLFERKNQNHQSKPEHGRSLNWGHANKPQESDGGSAQTKKEGSQTLPESLDDVKRGSLINF